MYSISIDYLFNRVYDALLWIKYVWLFDILRTNPDTYLSDHKKRVWDGLRDRGWFDAYLKQKEIIANQTPTTIPHTFLEQTLQMFGFKLRDSDYDGIFDVSDKSPFDPNNLTSAQMKERYQSSYDVLDRLRDNLGIGPRDTDGDGVPDSYEKAHGMNPNDPDTDHDGLFDGQELMIGTNPLKSDTDGDGVLDSRDEAPLDYTVSSIGPDSDGDSVSDRIENLLGTDIHKIDTDGDGIPDGIDTYPLDPHNISNISLNAFDDTSKQLSGGLHLAIQNPILSFVSDILSILLIFAMMFLVYVSTKWFIEFWRGLNHYEHHFSHGHHKNELHHKEKTGHDTHHEEETFMGIQGLAVKDGEHLITPPTEKDFENHPRWAIIEGYMSSNNEALWRIGIIESDNMLREVLIEKGYTGIDVGEMLTNAKFNTIQLAWDAHKVRNRIAHEGSDYTLTDREAKRVNGLYEAIFKELKAIQ